MKTKHFLPFIAMAIGMGCCTNDLVDETNPLMGKRDVITVNVGDESTRTAMDGNNVVWSETDAIGIFAGSMNNEYSLSSGAGTTSAEFTGLAPQSLKEAAYFPFVQGATWANNVISTTLPTAYTYSAESNNNAVMAALMAEDAQSSISFQNAGALYAITVENIPAGYDKAVMTYLGADDKVGIAGAATITFVDGVPTLAVPEAADAASAQKAITITFTGTGSKTFYFPMPVIDMETFPGLQFSLQGEGKTPIKVPAYIKKPQRNKLYAETWTLDAVSGGIVSEANDIEAANAALANDAVTSVAVKDVSGTEPITIPAKSESADVPHTIDLSDATLPTGTDKVTISVDNTANETTVKELTVVVPDAATAGNLVIDAPGTTVTIQVANGTVLDTIEAATAENTLIIGEGVTVTNLIVKGGNVRVQGTIFAISRADDNADEVTYIIYEEGAVIPENLGENIEAVSAAEWDLRKAIDNVANSGTVTLTEDVVLTKQLTITKSLTLDLAGHTIKNTTEIWNPDVAISHWSLISAQGENVAVTIKGNGNVLSKENDCYAVDARDGATITLENGTFNGNVTAVYVKFGGNAVIKGGEFKIQQVSEVTGDHRYLLNIYDKTDGTITVTGGKFYQFDPANSNGENPIANFVPSGYQSTTSDNGETYVVTASTEN